MAGSVHWALIVVRGTLSSWARCPVNSVLDSSNTAGTAPGGLPGQAFLLDATGPLSRFQGPKFRQGMDRFNVRSDPVVRPAQGLARIGSGCHVSVGGTFRCSPPRRSSPYTACCLSLSTQASRSPSRPHPRSRCPARSPGESNRPPAPPLPTPRPAAGPHVPPAHLLQKALAGAVRCRQRPLMGGLHLVLDPHTELAEKALRVPDLPTLVREKVPVAASGSARVLHVTHRLLPSPRPFRRCPRESPTTVGCHPSHGLCGPRRATGLQ